MNFKTSYAIVLSNKIDKLQSKLSKYKDKINKYKQELKIALNKFNDEELNYYAYKTGYIDKKDYDNKVLIKNKEMIKNA